MHVEMAQRLCGTILTTTIRVCPPTTPTTAIRIPTITAPPTIGRIHTSRQIRPMPHTTLLQRTTLTTPATAFRL